MSARNSMLMCLTSYLGNDKALIAEVLTAMFKSFEDVTKNPSKADNSGSENNGSKIGCNKHCIN